MVQQMDASLRSWQHGSAVVGPSKPSGAKNGAAPTPVVLTTNRVKLREVGSADYDFLYQLSMRAEVSFRWRYRGITPSPDEFVRNLWQNVTAQFLVTEPSSGRRLGHVVGFDANHRDGWIHVAAVGLPEIGHTGLVVEATGLLVDYLFANWNFHKVYFSSIEFNVHQFESGLTDILIEEGRLRRHCFYGDRYWDMVILALHRENWLGDWRSHVRRITTSNVDAAMRGSKLEKEALPSLEQFIEMLNEIAVERGPSITDPDDNLVGDLGFDSLQMLMALDLISSIADQEELPELDGSVIPMTVRELYLLMCKSSQMPDSSTA